MIRSQKSFIGHVIKCVFLMNKLKLPFEKMVSGRDMCILGSLCEVQHRNTTVTTVNLTLWTIN